MAGISGVTLFDDEEIVYKTTPSWLAYGGRVFIDICLCFVLIGFWTLWRTWRKKKTTVHAVTTHRVIKRKGRRSVRVDDYRIEDIAKVRTRSTKVFLLWTVESVVFDIQHGETVTLNGVPNASEFVAKIREQQQQIA